jgi:hypothetical protein
MFWSDAPPLGRDIWRGGRDAGGELNDRNQAGRVAHPAAVGYGIGSATIPVPVAT